MRDNALLIDFIAKLKENNFKVYTSSKEPVSYVHFENEKGQIGYCEAYYFGGLNFGTVHKPNRETGTGFGMSRENYNPTIENAKECFAMAPHWGNTKSVIKYKNFAEYMKRETVLKQREL